MEENRTVKLFLDDDPNPFAEFASPVKFVFDTTKIPDGKHTLKIVAKSTDNVEGIRSIPFEVRNGPAIAVVGLKENEIVNDQIPITVNAYGSERNDVFVVTGSETPKAIPAWVWALLIAFGGFAIFYLIMYLSPDLYKSFV
ncbi:MAG: cytochrome C [Chitinophagales bacterium]|nr:cytochrome C [Chitinophagales bacterium]